MALDFITDDVKTELGLTDEVIGKLEPLYTNKIAELKNEFTGQANENAENILSGATKKWMEISGITEERKAGEKWADYYARVLPMANKADRDGIAGLKADYEQKLKDFKGGDALQSELNLAKGKLDDALQKFADYDTLKATAEKYEPLAQENAAFKKQVAFGSVKPSFPDTVNEYEAKAKWNDFVKIIEEKWNIEVVDGESIAIDKENPHKQAKLKDLVAADENLSRLLQGRQQRGMNGNPANLNKVDGIDFEVPAKADSAALTKAVDEYLGRKGISKTSDQYATQFQELYAKAKEASNK